MHVRACVNYCAVLCASIDFEPACDMCVHYFIIVILRYSIELPVECVNIHFNTLPMSIFAEHIKYEQLYVSHKY